MKKFAKVMALILVVAMSLALLVACAPNKDPEKAEQSLKDNGYATTNIKSLTGIGGLITTVSGTKIVEDKNGNKKVESVTIMYYGSAAQANAAYDDVKSESDEKGKNESSWIIGISGSMIYFGTSAAIKAAK